jgi:hypothetical protein
MRSRNIRDGKTGAAAATVVVVTAIIAPRQNHTEHQHRRQHSHKKFSLSHLFSPSYGFISFVMRLDYIFSMSHNG